MLDWLTTYASEISAVANVVMAAVAIVACWAGIRAINAWRRQVPAQESHRIADEILGELNKLPILVEGIHNQSLTAWTQVPFDATDREASIAAVIRREYDEYWRTILEVLNKIEVLAVQHQAYLGPKWLNLLMPLRGNLLNLKYAMADVSGECTAVTPDKLAKSKALLKVDHRDTDEANTFLKNLEGSLDLVRGSLEQLSLPRR